MFRLRRGLAGSLTFVRGAIVIFPQPVIYAVLGLQEGSGTREVAGRPLGEAGAVDLDASLF